MGFSLFVSRLAGCPTVGDEFCADRPLQPAFSARRFFGTRGDTRFNAGYGLPGTLSRNETVLNQNWITGEMALFRQLSVVAAVSVPWVGRFRSQKQCPHHGRNISHGRVYDPLQSCVFCFGLFEDWNVGVSVFPQRKKIAVLLAGAAEITHHDFGSGQL